MKAVASSIHFEPAPPNDFAEYIHGYFTRCKAAHPKVIGISGKWSFEDLIPGLSDFDARLLFADGVTRDEWRTISSAIGNVHTTMVVERPQWKRNLEHLPGMNMTVSETVNPAWYYPESAQWTYYDGPREALDRISGYLAARGWTERDEIFHLKKFAAFWGPYQRGIDPPINMGKWESKYPLHSRYIHYFAPPVQAAVSLAMRRPCRGKLEAFRLARGLFPGAHVIDRFFAAFDRHFEVAQDYFDPRLAELEAEMERFLAEMYRILAPGLTVIKASADDTPAALREKLGALPEEPLGAFAVVMGFSRLMKGRLEFFGADLPMFDSDFLVRNELGRIGTLFCDNPLKAYAAVRYKESLTPMQVLARLRGGLLTPAECDGFMRFFTKAAEPIPQGMHKQRSRETAEMYDPVFIVHDKLARDLETNVGR